MPPDPPAAPPPAPAPASQPSIAQVKASIQGTKIVISCSAGSGNCSGTITLSITEKIVASRVVAFGASHKAKSKIVVIGKASFNVPSGATRTITVKYNRVGAELLRRHHKLAGLVQVVQGTVAVKRSATV
jgi:hypothetical protein